MADFAPKRLRVAVTGASGFLGKKLVARLVARGHDVTALSRSSRGGGASDGVRWVAYDPLDAESCARAIDGADAVVNLAGHGVFDGRWNRARMELIRSSRVDGTRALVDGLKRVAKRPSVLVSASAVGIYGPRHPAEDIDEASAPGNDFLAQVCIAWEAEARMAEDLGIRVANPRFGVVLGRGGGAMASMIPPFRMFLGGPIGLTGRQPFAWVHIDDVVGLCVEMVENPAYRGPVNVVAPELVDSKRFAHALGRALHRPSFLPTPGFAIRVLVGKAAQVLTTGQRVHPRVALAHGYAFRFPTVEGALADLLAEATATEVATGT